MLNINKTENGIIILTIDVKDRPMNVITESFLATLETMVEEITKDQDSKGLILTSARDEFMAGADLEMIINIEDPEKCYEITRRLQKTYRAMETWGKPVVAAINGTALGGGYELCLACHYRIALDRDDIRIGLPEVTLGLLPGAGGTQKLPRMLGIQKALPFLMQGRTVSPKEAHEYGLVNELAKDNLELMEKAKFYVEAHPEGKQPWDQKGFKIPGGPVQSPQGYQIIPAATAMLNEKTHGNYPAPLNILKCVYEGLQIDMDKALDVEARYFSQLVISKEAKHMMRTLFYSINECNKGAARPKDIEKKEIKKVGILGAGMMGQGIAYSSAKAGISVVLKDVSKEVAQKGKAYSEKLMDKAISRGRATEEDKRKLLELIKPTDDVNALAGCDLVIEAVIEDRKIKAIVTQETEDVLDEKAIFSSNTSTIPISSLAKTSKRPKQFIGLHFFSPVDKMPLVEIIMGKDTGEDALALCLDYCKKIKKTPIVVNDGRGFYTSRVFTTYVSEGINCLVEGISPALIENAGKACGMPVGPLAVADEVSLDLIYHIIKQTKDDLGDESVDRNTWLVADSFVNKLGRLGRKSGKGFYEYPPEGRKFLSPELSMMYPLAEVQPDIEEVKRRLLTIQSLETLRCMEDGVLTTARDGDVGSILGWGFPAYTGGSLSYIEMRGPRQFLEDCEEFEKKYGKRFKPNGLTKDIGSSGETGFYTPE